MKKDDGGEGPPTTSFSFSSGYGLSFSTGCLSLPITLFLRAGQRGSEVPTGVMWWGGLITSQLEGAAGVTAGLLVLF